MRYLLIVMVIASVFFLRPAPAPAVSCSFGLTNCTGVDTFDWCSYNGSSFWDTLYSAAGNSDQDTDTTDCVDYGCDTDSSCYVIVLTSSTDFFDCTSYTYDGFVDCDDNACVDFDNGFQTSSDPYTCENDLCVTDSSEDSCFE